MTVRFLSRLLLFLMVPYLSAQAASPSIPKMGIVLDRLTGGQVFTSAPFSLLVEGLPLRQTQRETFFTDKLLSGIEQKRYSYFLFRNPLRPAIDRFDIVFFNADGSGYAVGIPSKWISEFDESKVIFSILLEGGGEAGRATTRRTFSFSKSVGNEDHHSLNVLLEEVMTTSSIWAGRRTVKSRAEIQFKPVELPETLSEIAREMDLGKKVKSECRNGGQAL